MKIHYIPLSECKNRYLYRIHSRNLSYGIYNEKTEGFIGIRNKFGDDYLFTEYHYDIGMPYGTVFPKQELFKIPDDLELIETLGTIDNKSKRSVEFDKPIREGGKGWFYSDTGESDKDIHPTAVPNEKLFEFLKGFIMEKQKFYELSEKIAALMESYKMKVYDLEFINELIEKTIERNEKECSY